MLIDEQVMDDSPGDVIAAYPDGTIVLDDGITTWAPQRALTFLQAEVNRLQILLNSPEVNDFIAGVKTEAAHQRERWGGEQDLGKTPEDWFWLIGYLAGKALSAIKRGDQDKALHHAVTCAAALANWHAAIARTVSPSLVEKERRAE